MSEDRAKRLSELAAYCKKVRKHKEEGADLFPRIEEILHLSSGALEDLEKLPEISAEEETELELLLRYRLSEAVKKAGRPRDAAEVLERGSGKKKKKKK